MPKFDAKYLNNLRNRKKERLDDFEVKLKEQNSDPKYAVTIGEFCKSEFELNVSQYQTANSTNKDLTLNNLLYYYFFLNENSKNDEFLEEKGAMKQFFNSIDITDKQLEAIGQYANKEKRILADIEDIGKDGTEISESNRRKDEVLKKTAKTRRETKKI